MIRKEPGLLFASIFLVMGLTFVIAVAIGEENSPVAGQAWGKGPGDGGDWQVTEFPPVEFN